VVTLHVCFFILYSLFTDLLVATDDPRRVVILKMRVICEGRPDGDIVYNLDTQDDVDKMKNTPFTLKEGCNYKIEVTFKVQHEIVSGLKYVNRVYRKGVQVMREDEMLGSFGPQAKPHVVLFPRHGWEAAPSGMLARGSYSAKSAFLDDDKQKHLEYQYAFGELIFCNKNIFLLFCERYMFSCSLLLHITYLLIF